MKTPRTCWFAFEFVAVLCALAFVAGIAVGIVVTLRIATKTAPPEMRELEEYRQAQELEYYRSLPQPEQPRARVRTNGQNAL